MVGERGAYEGLMIDAGTTKTALTAKPLDPHFTAYESRQIFNNPCGTLVSMREVHEN